MTFKKPNYENKLWKLKNKQEIIDRHIQELKEYEVLIYGKEGSMFYGLKTPSLYKILEYMCDTYKIPYDVMFHMIYENLMKIYYKKHMDRVFHHTNWYKGYDYRTIDIKRFDLKQIAHKDMNYYNHLYLGDTKYESGVHLWKYWSRITCKSKKHFKNRYNINTYGFKFLDKKQIIEQLNKLDINYKLTDTKEKLMGLLIKNEPSGIVDLSRFD